MCPGALDLVERMRCRDKYLFRHAPSVRACATEKIGLDHCDFEPRLPCRHGDTHPGIATAEDHDVEPACGHGHASIPPEINRKRMAYGHLGHYGQAIRFRAVRRDLVNPHEVTDRRSAAAVVRPRSEEVFSFAARRRPSSDLLGLTRLPERARSIAELA